MRHFLALFLFVFGCLVGSACTVANAAPPAHPAAEPVSFAETLAAKTVALVVQKDDEIRAYCSGVWVAPDLFVTAAHCVSGKGDLVSYVVRDDVIMPDGSLNPSPFVRGAFVAAFDEPHDLAAVRTLAAPRHGIAGLHVGDVMQGTRAYSMGHSRGLWWTFSSGDVAAVRMYDAGVKILWVQSTAPISPGNSGGGLFDADGALIGICSRLFPSGQNLNFFVHVQYVRGLGVA